MSTRAWAIILRPWVLSIVFIGATAFLHGELLVYEPFDGYGAETILQAPAKGNGLDGAWEQSFTNVPQEFTTNYDGLYFPGYPSTGGSLKIISGATERGSLAIALSPTVLDVVANSKEETLELWLGFLWMSTSPAETGKSTVGLCGGATGQISPPWAFGVVTRDRKGLGQIVGSESVFQFKAEEKSDPTMLLQPNRAYYFLSRISLSRTGSSGPWKTARMQSWRFEDGVDALPTEPPAEGAVESSGPLTPATQPNVFVIQPGAWGTHHLDEIRIGTSFRDVLPPSE